MHLSYLNAYRYLAMLLLLATLIAPTVFADTTLSFALYSTDRPTVVVRKFAPLLRELETRLSTQLNTPVKIKLDISKTYEDGRQKIVDGLVDFMRLGAASYVLVKTAEPDIQILAMELKKGKKFFNGIIATHEKNTLQTVADLSGKSFAFGNETSTIGRFLSQQKLMEHGVRSADLSSYHYLGRHDRVGIAVAKQQYDAGALKESTYEHLIKKGNKLRILASFPTPTKPWIARKGLSQDIKVALQNSLRLIKAKDGKTSRFTTGSDADFHTIRLAMEKNADFFTEQ